MGTTVTTNLGLIKPDISEKIKEDLPTFPGWASQNADNMDMIDSLFRASTATYSIAWTGAGSNPTIGSGGLLEGKYVRFFPRMVAVFFRIHFGSAGFVAGSGQYRISVPVAPDPNFAGFLDMIPIGKAMYQDASTTLTNSVYSVNWYPAANNLVLRPSTGDVWSSTVPIVPAQDDKISGFCIYPTAVA